LPGVAQRIDEIGADGEHAIQFGLDAEETAADQIAVDQGIDQVALDGVPGRELAVTVGDEGLQIGPVFAGDHGGAGVNAASEEVGGGKLVRGFGARRTRRRNRFVV
jgi:hypothetical protein